MTSIHPMLQETRPLIATRPMERLADSTALALEKGAAGMLTHGGGRIGKTKAAELLVQRLSWRPWPMYSYLMNYSMPVNGSETYFFNAALNASNQKSMNGALGTNVLTRLRNHLLRGAHQLNVKIIFLAINEANRFGLQELNHLVSLQNDIESSGKRLFVLLLSQNDADPGGPQGILNSHPRQISGRFLDIKHHYTGLLWDKPEDEKDNGLDNDVLLAMKQYEIGIPHGDDGIPCCRWFAPNACAAGWTFSSQFNDFKSEVMELRTREGLPELGPWPMQTFEPFVYYLLVRVAGDNPGFSGFTPVDIRRALQFSGYITWELNGFPSTPK